MMNTYSMIQTFVSTAIETSISTCKHGVPFGGSLSWLYVVLMTNDPGQYPWAQLQAAVIGYPIVIACDTALIIPALTISCLKSRGVLRD
jgi:hypothetical protein